jgi:hypothetical protein
MSSVNIDLLPVALRLWRHTRANVEFLNTRKCHRAEGIELSAAPFTKRAGLQLSSPANPAPAPPVAKKAQDWKIPVHSPFLACGILKRMFEFERLSGG